MEREGEGQGEGGGWGKALKCGCSPGTWPSHSQRSTKPLCWPTVSGGLLHQHIKDPHNNNLHCRVQTLCHGEYAAAQQEQKQRCGLNFTRVVRH